MAPKKKTVTKTDILEAKVDQLQEDVVGIRDRLDGIDERLDGIDDRLDKMDTKLDKILDVVSDKQAGLNQRIKHLELHTTHPPVPSFA